MFTQFFLSLFSVGFFLYQVFNIHNFQVNGQDKMVQVHHLKDVQIGFMHLKGFTYEIEIDGVKHHIEHRSKLPVGQTIPAIVLDDLDISILEGHTNDSFIALHKAFSGGAFISIFLLIINSFLIMLWVFYAFAMLLLWIRH